MARRDVDPAHANCVPGSGRVSPLVEGSAGLLDILDAGNDIPYEHTYRRAVHTAPCVAHVCPYIAITSGYVHVLPHRFVGDSCLLPGRFA